MDIINYRMVLIHLVDGAVSTFSDLTVKPYGISSFREHMPAPQCNIISLDLDHDDSSGAPDVDFITVPYTCLSDGVAIADDDTRMLYDTWIATMTIHLPGRCPTARMNNSSSQARSRALPSPAAARP